MPCFDVRSCVGSSGWYLVPIFDTGHETGALWRWGTWCWLEMRDWKWKISAKSKCLVLIFVMDMKLVLCGDGKLSSGWKWEAGNEKLDPSQNIKLQKHFCCEVISGRMGEMNSVIHCDSCSCMAFLRSWKLVLVVRLYQDYSTHCKVVWLILKRCQVLVD